MNVGKITYVVAYCEPQGGGMDYGTLGGEVETLQEALFLLKTAEAFSNKNWRIEVVTEELDEEVF